MHLFEDFVIDFLIYKVKFNSNELLLWRTIWYHFNLVTILIEFYLEGAMPRFSIAAAAANMAQYLSQSHNGQLKGQSGSFVDRPHLYWPGLQGLVTNPMAWRDRLTNSSKYSILLFFSKWNCTEWFDLYFQSIHLLLLPSSSSPPLQLSITYIN